MPARTSPPPMDFASAAPESGIAFVGVDAGGMPELELELDPTAAARRVKFAQVRRVVLLE